MLYSITPEEEIRCIFDEANLKNIFVSPYPTLFLQYGEVGWKITFFNFSNSIPIKLNCK